MGTDAQVSAPVSQKSAVVRWWSKIRRFLALIRIRIEGVTALEGPAERIDGKLTLRIPLDAGGRRLVRCSRGIAHVEGDRLVVVIPDWLAEKLHIEHGSQVWVDNQNAKFNLQLADTEWEARAQRVRKP